MCINPLINKYFQINFNYKKRRPNYFCIIFFLKMIKFLFIFIFLNEKNCLSYQECNDLTDGGYIYYDQNY